MPTLDVTSVLSDPYFQDTFTVIHTSQTVTEGGRAVDAPPSTVSAFGVVEPDRGRALQRLAAGSQITDAIKIYTRFRLTTGVGPTEADKVQWNGGDYVVVNVMDWSRFGAGYVCATCDLTDIS